MTDNTLMPCPCGRKAHLQDIQGDGKEWFIWCGDVECDWQTKEYNAPEHAIAAWHKRVTSWTQEDYEKAARGMSDLDYYAANQVVTADEWYNWYKHYYIKRLKAALDAVGGKND